VALNGDEYFSMLHARAQQGELDAQLRVADVFFSGYGRPMDYEAAAHWYRLAAEQGNARAQFNLGYMLAAGEGAAQDCAEAMKWYRLAAEQGHELAQNNLGNLYERGDELIEAARWYRRAAEQGCVYAQASLAFALSNGRGVHENLTEAVEWYRRAAEQGYAGAQLNLGGLYAFGRGVLRNYETALKWYRSAAAQGDRDAQFRLGLHYSKGVGTAQNPFLARLWFALASAQGCNVGLNESVSYRSPDPDIDRLISAASSGDPQAQRVLALRSREGASVPQDDAVASAWLRLAADGGDPCAQTILAIDLRKTGQPDNERESIRLLRLAAKQGFVDALHNLGNQEMLGIGTSVDPEAGALNLLRASLAGSVEARAAFEHFRPRVPNATWDNISTRVEWPDLIFLMGPLAKGHLDGVRQSQEEGNGSQDALWMRYESEAAQILFGPAAEGGSILNSAFDDTVTIRHYFVTPSSRRGGRSLP
jgi:TPR repeat protein